jgi:hypothetical protein
MGYHHSQQVGMSAPCYKERFLRSKVCSAPETHSKRWLGFYNARYATSADMATGEERSSGASNL